MDLQCLRDRQRDTVIRAVPCYEVDLFRNAFTAGNGGDVDDTLFGRFAKRFFAANYNRKMATIPAEIHGQKYISLATFRKSGVAVYTPIWFAEEGDKLYFMTNSKLGKVKRLRNNSRVKVAPCTIRGKITGPEFEATARILPAAEAGRARQAIRAKYWLARLPWLWRNSDTDVEIVVGSVVAGR
ncbi:MAG: PPOX class F420-dependent oxidoreductase [Terriglobales bacterium]|jgi:PPOX class probable F420-dependent enzyme